ncbi:hypothetical protein DYB32_008781, partial [Aphanomyces invadans]
MIGVSINSIPVMTHLTPSTTLARAVANMHEQSSDSIPHAHCGLVDIKKWAGVMAHNALFDTIMVYENYPASTRVHDPAAPFSIDLVAEEEFVDVTMSMVVVREDASYAVTLVYKCSETDASAVEHLMSRLAHVVTTLATPDELNSAISSLDIAAVKEQAILGNAMYGPTVSWPANLLLHHPFENQALQCPDARAIEFEDRYLTYGELNAQADTVAYQLANVGVRKDTRVAIIMERCLEFPIGMLAVLKAGATVLPLDATFPPSRLSYMLSDANAVAVLTTETHQTCIEELDLTIPTLYIDSSSLRRQSQKFLPSDDHRANEWSEAYVVYTSGSTGKPKGVPVFHKSAVNTILFSIGCTELTSGIRVLQFMAVGFDVYQWEVWGTLSSGATLVFRTNDSFDTLSDVNALTITPTGLSKLGDPRHFPRLKVVLVGGEALPTALKNLWCQHVRLINAYGPTECCILSHVEPMVPQEDVTIGSPISNVTSYILDENQGVVPVGVIGELYLGGVCVSPYYINLPEQTEERFLVDPFSGGRMFRTGDFARLLPNGKFEILGRKDSQVKLKGYRIELEEVANAMMLFPSVVTAAAIVKNSTLVGYYSPSSVALDELQAFVSTQLPVYMVPSVWTGLDVMPQNSNGKVDKKALEALELDVTVEALESASEKLMATVWAQVLRVDVSMIGRHTSFFSVGGDSLSAVQVVSACAKIGLPITVRQLMQESVLSKVAACVAISDDVVYDSVAVSQATEDEVRDLWSDRLSLDKFIVYPTTPLQAGMIYSTMMSPSSYLLQVPIAIEDDVSTDQFCSGFVDLVDSSETLRTTFVTTTEGIVQVIREDGLTPERVSVDDLRTFIQADFARGFCIGDKHFVRLTIVTEGPRRHAVLSVHHALYDGWSIELVLSDLMDRVYGKPVVSRPPFRHVVDYIHAQDKTQDEEFWKSYLAGVVSAPLALSTTKSDVESGSLSLTPTLPLGQLTDLAKEMGSTVAVCAKLAWAATLRKFTRSNDVVFGQVTANRDILLKDVDLYVTLDEYPPIHFDNSCSVLDLVDMVQQDQRRVSLHAHVGLSDVKQWSGVEGALFNTLFVFQNASMGIGSGQDVVEIESQKATGFDFELIVETSSAKMFVTCLYDPAQMSWSQARSIVDEFDFTLSQFYQACLAKQDASHLWLLSPSKLEAIMKASTGPATPLPHCRLHAAFEDIALRQPTIPAVEFKSMSLTYGQLNAQANAVARLLTEVGVRVGTRVAVIMERCLEFPIGMLAVLKAGGTMMPMDASFPANRLSYMVSDGNAIAVVTTKASLATVEDMNLSIAVMCLDSSELALQDAEFSPAANQVAAGDDEAYVVYTSGSTGKPKGVPVLHKGAANFILHISSKLDVHGARVLQFLAMGFDGCQWETWMAFSTASVLVLRSNDLENDFQNVNAMVQTATGLTLMGDPLKYPNLKLICVGGEAMTPHLRDAWSDHVCLVHAYGPSEASIITHAQVIEPTSQLTVGGPISNVTSYILDENQCVVPVGVIGELYLGGVCVSPYYINLPEQTEERFLADPFSGGRMFRTGDFARLLPNGKFEILGRKDSQVKLKGYRIELEEVAKAMMLFPSVATAAAIVKNSTLVGYYSPSSVALDELQAFVSTQLPVYMVPAVWTGLDVMPQNSNGKVDKKALEALELEVTVEALESASEKLMATVWAQVLRVDESKIGRHTSFFSVGGDSLSAVQVVSACAKIGLPITVRQLMQESVLSKVAA